MNLIKTEIILDEFFKTISYDEIINIFKKFNIDIFFNIYCYDKISYNLKSIQTYFKLKNINLYIKDNIFLSINGILLTSYLFTTNNSILNKDYFYFILKYIKENWKSNDYFCNNFYLVFYNTYSIKNIEKFFKEKYNLLIKLDIKLYANENYVIYSLNKYINI